MKNDLMVMSGTSAYLLEVYDTLRYSGIKLIHVENIHDAKAGLSAYSPAFILLDFDIKGTNYLLAEIAFGQYIPQPYIIIATDYTDGNDRAAMLHRGADYCIDKPINAQEILAVMDAVLRRRRSSNTMQYKELNINPYRRSVTMRGEPVVLTRKEYEVLCFLANHAGMILTKEEIYCAVWKTEFDSKSTNVSDQISSLRSKLGLSSKDTHYIRTVIGVGYCFGDVG